MNETIKILNDHRSIREYTSEPVTAEQSAAIMDAAASAPSWINGQQVSVIEVRDTKKKELLAELSGGQAWVAEAPVFYVFCLDFYRAKLAAEKNHAEFHIADHVESLLVGATDTGIAMGAAITAAESMGLGTVPVGGIRKGVTEVIELLELPQYVFPVAGLAVGHPADRSAKKPRLPREAVYHKEMYSSDLKASIDEYDQTISDYMIKRTGGMDNSDWSAKIASFYDQGFNGYRPVEKALKKQGFNI